MGQNRRSVILSSCALIAGTTGVLVPDRDGSAETDSTSGPASTRTTQLDRAGANRGPGVTGEWTAYKYDAANTGNAAETTGPRESVQEMWAKDFDQGVYCTPAVVEGRVFVGTYSFDVGIDDSDSHGGSIRAFDAATGEKQWEVPTGRIHTSSPTVVDETLYINSGDFESPKRVHAVDTTSGEEQWTHEFDAGERIRSSPTVTDGSVYATAEIATDEKGETDVAVHAIDAATGEQQWAVTIKLSALGYSSPAVVDGTVYHHSETEGGTELELFAFDAETGERKWAVPTCSMTGSPTVVDGTLYHSNRFDGGVVARDASTGEELWRTERDVHPRFGPAVADGTVYATSVGSAVYGTTNDPGSVFAVDAASGELEWEHDTGEARGSPVVDADTVYVPSWGDERIYAIDADEGTEQWHFDLVAPPYQPPAVVDGTLFVGDVGRWGGLYAVTGQ